MMKTLSEIAKEKAKKQPHQIDEILEEAPVLARLKFEEATHDFHNVAEEVTDVTGATWVPMNGVLPTVDAVTNLRKVDLAIMGGEIEVPEDTAKVFGGKDSYFAKKLPKVHKKTGMDTERRIIYDNWKRYAITNKMAYKTAAASGAGYSIIAVRLVSGEHNGLYSPSGFNQGTMLNVMALNGGNLYKSVSDKYKGVNVYGIRLKAYLGWQILNKRTCAAIVNIQPDKLPTAMQIDDMLADIRATDSGNTMLIMHPKCRNLLGGFKESKLMMSVGEKNFSQQLMNWNGIPILTTYNMDDGTEPFVTIA